MTEYESEDTPEGAQALVAGVPDVTTREKLEAAFLKPLRGSCAPCDTGLFDECARNQLDLLDLL